MNRILYTVTQCKTLLFVLFIGMLAAQQAHANRAESMDNMIEGRILSLGSSVDVKYSPEVKKRIKQYIKTQRKTSEILLGRSSLYFPTFERILGEKGLPDDLKYLSVVESGLKAAATSRSGAAGLWQFMRPTGRMMGLKITRTVDERRDIEKSTAAAAEYLYQLYTQFDDWTLAIAAYNCGPGNMRKAIRKSGGKRNFWEIEKYLPRETRNYVPKFIAMTYVMNYYYDHDLIPVMPDASLVNTSRARVFEEINLKKLSTDLDIELTTMRILNPSFIRNYIPKSDEGKYYLVLPTPEMRIVAGQYHVLAELPLLKEKKQEIVKEQRAIVEIATIPAAEYITAAHENAPTQLRPTFVHPVAWSSHRQEQHKAKPEVYKINQDKRTISSLGKMIKNSLIKA